MNMFYSTSIQEYINVFKNTESPTLWDDAVRLLDIVNDNEFPSIEKLAEALWAWSHDTDIHWQIEDIDDAPLKLLSELRDELEDAIRAYIERFRESNTTSWDFTITVSKGFEVSEVMIRHMILEYAVIDSWDLPYINVKRK
jgi:hypothetical protein